MFDSSRLPHVMTAQDYAAFEENLRERLLDAQFELAERKRASVLVLVNGSDGAGKGEVVDRLYEWLDDHFVETLTYGEPTDEERARPRAWRYWRDMPAKGRIGVMLGAWHHDVLLGRAQRRLDRAAFVEALAEINRSEEMLRKEGVFLLKIWLSLDDRLARRRLARLRERNGALRRPAVIEWAAIDRRKERERLNAAALEMIEITSTGDAPWSIVPGEDHHYRDAAIGDLLLQLLCRANNGASETSGRPEIVATSPAAPGVSLATGLNLSRKADADEYARDLRDLQRRLTEATTSKAFRARGLVVAFEGNDAAGKGGAIRRVRAALDPRRFRVHGVAAPTDEERARPYLWRFWRNIPRRGDTTIFDRSWYGRVLVERVEGFAAEDDWRRAYQEINDFERQLVDAHYCVVKLWLAISPEEQLRRFEARESSAIKRHKITPEDWRNREKWPLYESAMTEMIDRTSARHAPWTLVEANDKKFARLKVLRTILERLEA